MTIIPQDWSNSQRDVPQTIAVIYYTNQTGVSSSNTTGYIDTRAFWREPYVAISVNKVGDLKNYNEMLRLVNLAIMGDKFNSTKGNFTGWDTLIHELFEAHDREPMHLLLVDNVTSRFYEPKVILTLSNDLAALSM